MTRPTLAQFKQKALADPEVSKAYDACALDYKLRKKLIILREKAGFTHEEMAMRLDTHTNAISQLENISTASPLTLSMVEHYVNAVGYKLNISFVPQ